MLALNLSTQGVDLHPEHGSGIFLEHTFFWISHHPPLLYLWMNGTRRKESLMEKQEGSTSFCALSFIDHRAEHRWDHLLIRHMFFFLPNIFSNLFLIIITSSDESLHLCPFTAFPSFLCSQGVSKLLKVPAEHH